VIINEQQDQVNDEAELLAEAFTSLEVLARALRVKEARLQPTLDAIVSAACAISPGHDAGLILLIRGILMPQATTSNTPHLLDLLQQKDGEGPCIEAARQQAVIQIEDTTLDVRWPRFCAAAQELGVRSMLCVPLWVDERCLGTLSLYGAKPAAFTSHDERIATLFATLAALALAEAQRTDQLRAALDNRDFIGQAKGILMHRDGITAEVAFACLARASQHTNTKLVDVARHLAETGELASIPDAALARSRPE
jgi:GAF domain-containing protein